MNQRWLAQGLGMITICVGSCFLTGCSEDDGVLLKAAAAPAPDSLVGRRYSFTETGGTSAMLFLENNRYELIQANGLIESGYFFATRNGEIWSVSATRADGSLTTQYKFDFTTSENGQVTTTVAGEPHKNFVFQDTTSLPGTSTSSGTSTSTGTTTGTTTGGGGGPTDQFAPVALASMTLENHTSAAGPSFFKIHFTGATNGTFSIDLPGYGFGTFVYTPQTNAAKLVLTYTGDLTGDTDDLDLEFKAATDASTPSHLTGFQRVSGQNYPIHGSFVYAAAAP